MAELRQQGILAGNFYWFDNNWHYIRKWDHLREAATLNKLADSQQKALLALPNADFSASDRIMGRCVSTAIGLLWTEEQTQEKGEKLVAAIKKVLSREKMHA
jgi:8-amino-3,8-dideoxy-alpha-D-manno-octulosonate transaminase